VAPVTTTPATVTPVQPAITPTVVPVTAGTGKTVPATDKPYLVTSFEKKYTDYFSL